MTEGSNGLIGEVYLHINNGGTSFRVRDDAKCGPTIEISSRHFGHIMHESRLMLTAKAAKELSALFALVAEHDFGGREYCCAADTVVSRNQGAIGSFAGKAS
jgi:hypothetical protein